MSTRAAVTDSMTENPCSARIRVLLQTENRLLHQALVYLFSKRADLELVGETCTSHAKASDLHDTKCDVLLIASVPASWPLSDFRTHLGLDGLKNVGFKTVLINMDADEEQFLSAVRSGVNGYLLKDASASDIVSAVQAVHRGEVVCPPRLCSALFRWAAKAAEETSRPSAAARLALTLRQQQLVALVAKGLTNKQIASRLRLSSFTVRNHIHRILKQVDAHSRSEAVETIRAHGYSLDV